MSDFGRQRGMNVGWKKEPWERERRAGKDPFKDHPGQGIGVRIPKSSGSSRDQSVGTADPGGPSLSSGSFLPTPEIQKGIGEQQDQAGRGTGFRDGQGGSFGGTREASDPMSPAFHGLEPEDERIKQTQARVAEAMSRYEEARKALGQDTLSTYAVSGGGGKPFEPSPVASSYAASAGTLKSKEEREREGRLREVGEAYDALPFPSVGERAGFTLSGAGKQYAGSMAQAGKTILFPGYGGMEEQINTIVADEEEKEKLLGMMDEVRDRTRSYAQGMQDFADRMSESGAQDIARAQEGLDPMGKMLVNAGAAAIQMGGDAAVALATGGGSMLPMVARSFGGGVQEARAKGYGEGRQVLLGLANAATEYFSERLFGGNPVYDTDVGLVNRLVGKLVKNPKVMEVLSSAPVEMLNEGLEEVVGDLLEPIAEWAITGTRPEYELDRIVEDGITGVMAAVMAGGGSQVVNKATNLVSNAAADKLLLDRNTVDFLTRKGGLKLNKKMTQEQKRTALRQAVENVVHKKAASKGEAGEYRAAKPENVELPTVPIINLSLKNIPNIGTNIPKAGNSLRADAIKRARGRLGLDVRSEAYIPASNVMRDGAEYILKITKRSLTKMLSPTNEGVIPIESIVVLDNIERIANNGVWFDGQGDRNMREQIAGFDHLKTTVYIDNVPYLVDIRVKLLEEKGGEGIENVLYYFTPEEIVSIEKIKH